MSVIGIAIGAAGLALLLLVAWMFALSLKKKRLELEKRERETAYRKALEKSRKQEHEERIAKAENGHVPTILYLAKEAERTNLVESLQWYQKAAELDNITGMYGIVRVSDRMRQDLVLKEQVKYWKTCISAMEGDHMAKFDAAIALFHGRGIDQNTTKALEMMTQAAEANNTDAMLFLGDWCQSEHNVEPKLADSSYWYRRAAQHKSSEGCMKLGLNYLNGIGVEKDHLQGCYWLERAAEQGNAQAMFYAGEAWNDWGSSGNAIAYIWLFLASQMGYPKAKTLRDQVALKIGVDNVVGLQSLAKPLIRRIQTGDTSKHTIIRALNKLYKRKVPLLKEDSGNEESLDLLQAAERVAESQAQTQTESEAIPQSDRSGLVASEPPLNYAPLQASVTEAPKLNSLDFSSTNMDKSQ
ncbi:tetratricopeptide repeat protein [Vibrio sp.]|uniref:tetratricopeptide repeat protein n=1 Tax=Vibrio sp. TaxID=678 RepID=UPI003D0A51C8